LSTFKWFASLFFAATIIPTILAETRCPGNAASITPRLVEHALIVIPVMINRAGPFDFIVDTGSQVTMIDPTLASQLQLKLQGTVGVISVAGSAKGSVTVLDTLEANSRVLEKPVAIVYDLGPIQAADARIRGVLGESFLSHFDLFIDYVHKLLCLDQSRTMRDSVRGERIPLAAPQHPENEMPFMQRLVIAAHLSGTGTRQILLQVDSGIDGPMLYARDEPRVLPLLKRATPREGNLTEAQRAFAVLPPQEVRIGKRTLSHVMFVTPVRTLKNDPQPDEDGLLPTLLFQRVFICGADHYVVFDPK
jgi:hypothetical protein